jgi:hypothetical protein
MDIGIFEKVWVKMGEANCLKERGKTPQLGNGTIFPIYKNASISDAPHSQSNHPKIYSKVPHHSVPSN